MTTDTPLTDAARQKYYDGTLSEWVHYKIAMMLEHELNDLWSRFDKQMEAEAEVERLKAMPHYHHESYCRKCGAKHEITKSVISENQLKVE